MSGVPCPMILSIPVPIQKLMPNCFKIIATHQDVDFWFDYIDDDGNRRTYSSSINAIIPNTQTKVAMHLVHVFLDNAIYLRNGDKSLFTTEDIKMWEALSIGEVSRY